MAYLSESKNEETSRAAISNLLKQKGEQIKKAELIYMNYVDKIIFAALMLLSLPIIAYFVFQLAFMSKIAKFTYSSAPNAVFSIVLLIADFYFIVLVYNDIEKSNKNFKFK